MDPRHRDRVAFVRVCSGRFTKDMVVIQQPRRQAAARLARLPVLRPRPRDHQPWPTPATSSASSTPASSPSATRVHTGAPRALSRRAALSGGALRRACACRTRATSSSTKACGSSRKKGLMQVFYVTAGRREPIVGVVGALQFDVIASRLRTEYGVEIVRSIRRPTPRRAGLPIRPDRCRSSAAPAPSRSIARDAACCCSPTSGKCSTSRSRTRRSRCWPNRPSPSRKGIR